MGQGICYACTRHLQLLLLLLLLLLLIYLYRFFSASDSKLDLCFPPPTCPLMSATHCATSTTTITAMATTVWFVRQLPFSPDLSLSLFLFPPAPPPLCWTLHGCQLMYNTAEEFLLSCFMYCAQFAICCYFFLLKQLRQIALLWTKKKKKQQKQRRSKRRRRRRLRCPALPALHALPALPLSCAKPTALIRDSNACAHLASSHVWGSVGNLGCAAQSTSNGA